MYSRKEVSLDPKKFLSADRIRINLLLTSLYLTAFEILKNSIIEGTRDFFIEERQMADEEVQKWKNALNDEDFQDIVGGAQRRYIKEADKYIEEIGIKPTERDRRGLIPSSQWLQKMGVLEEGEIQAIRKIRDHRNEIAHELPNLLIGEDFEVDLNHFQQIGEILHKVNVFWARSTLLFDPTTWEEIDVRDVPDDSILSGSIIVLNEITNAVAEYLNN